MNAIATIDKENQANLSDYLSKKKAADAIVAKNLLIQKSNDEGLAKVKAENDAITKRNQEGQAAIDAANKAGQAAVEQENQANQKLVTDRANEIDAITKRNQEKEDAAKKENEAIDAYNTKEMDRYKRDLAEISKGEEGYISEALDYSFSKQEIVGQLEVIITSRENDFPDLDEVTRDGYLELVSQLEELDEDKANHYCKQSG